MYYRPFVLGLGLALCACQSAPVPTSPTAPPSAGPTVTPTQAPSSAPTATPTLAPTPTPTPTPTATPTPTPLVFASVSPLPSGAPAPLGDANHGSAAFPTAPGSSAENIPVASASAIAGQESARGAIDGRLYTEWSARQPVSDPVSLTLDLGSSQTFSKVDLLPDASPDINCFFNVDVSPDNQTWTTVGTGNAFGSNNVPVWGTAQFTPQTARYLRIKPTSWGASWVAVWEVRVRK